MAATECSWNLLPDCVVIDIFSYLPRQELGRVAQTCRSWCQISYDEQLWRNAFYRDWGVSRNIGLAPNATSWRHEYRRLVFETPRVNTETVDGHADEVLHVCFSHDGDLLASSSKDGFVKVWNNRDPVTVRYSHDMKAHKWKHAIVARFNESDTLLLVSGQLLEPLVKTGEIAVFSLEDRFELQCRVNCNPCQFFGAWYSDDYLISANLYILGHRVSSSVLYVNRASQESDSERKSVMAKLYQFYNTNYAVRFAIVADCLDDASTSTAEQQQEAEEGEIILEEKDKYLVFVSGTRDEFSFRIGFKRIHPIRFLEHIDLNLKDKLAEYMQRVVQNATMSFRDWEDEESVRHMFDSADHYIECPGFVVGMALSPDHRYLYANCRSWPAGYEIDETLDLAPPSAQAMEIHVIDMLTLKEVGSVFKSHKAYSSRKGCYGIFLDVSENYVASGSEDPLGYLWDRHYGMRLSHFEHNKIVGCVAFNPCDEEMLVTASDDHTFKVWRSKSSVIRACKAKQLREANNETTCG